MKKIHLCAGSVYLRGFENCDITGNIIEPHNRALIEDGSIINSNETTLDKYFKDPFEPDSTKRVRKSFIIDTKMNILEKWPWKDNSVDEIVMINGFEHFEPFNGELSHIISEAQRVLKKGGIWRFDFPDIKKIVDKYYYLDPEFCMSLIYCNRKNKYSVHTYGYTCDSIINYLITKKWKLKFEKIVKHDYPSQGVLAWKK